MLKGSFSRDAGLFFLGNILNLMIIPGCCFLLCNRKYGEVSNWIERDLFTLFMEKRPLREHDEMIENAIWDDIVWELNQKIVQEYGMNDYYSRRALISELNTKILQRSIGNALPGRIPRGRDGIVLAAKKIRDKDIESNFPPEIIEWTNNFDDERGHGESKETM